MSLRRHPFATSAPVATFVSGTLAAGSAPGVTFGPDLTLTVNAGLFSDYRFRGFTQTAYKPAFQGGFDLSHGSGFYIGNWHSNVEQGLYRGASLEMGFATTVSSSTSPATRSART